jgi:hypothetical protein
VAVSLVSPRSDKLAAGLAAPTGEAIIAGRVAAAIILFTRIEDPFQTWSGDAEQRVRSGDTCCGSNSYDAASFAIIHLRHF